MYVRDLEGNEYAVQCTSTWQGELNGDQFFNATIEPNKPNMLFIHDIAEMWIIADHDDVEYKIIYCKKQGEGDSLTVNIKAIPLFFDVFNTQRIYERVNQHMTDNAFFNFVFDGSGYNFILSDSFSAQDWQGLGDGATRLDMFQRGLNRYKAEFRISGNTVYLERQIGRDTQFMYRYKLNASNIAQEIDAEGLYTYAKGYGDFEEGTEDLEENAGLIREYTSPLAEIIGIREAPPIKNGSITTIETMDEQLETLVNESLTVSVTTDIHDLREQGYPLAQPQLGDRVFLIDERIGFDQEVRIVDIEITKDWEGNVIDVKLTFGSQDISKRHQAELNSAAKSMTQLLEGRIKLPFSVLDNAVAQATRNLQRMETQLSISENGSLVAVDKDDPNNVVIVNAAGIGVSDDGGATFKNAITGLGINASVVTTGVMLANRLRGGILESLNENFYLNMDNGFMSLDNTDFQFGGNARITFTDEFNKVIYRTQDDRTGGLGVGLSTNGYSPITYIGTVRDGTLQIPNASFSGFMAVSKEVIDDESGQNAVIGNRFQIRNLSTGYDKGYTFDLSGNNITMRPMSTGSYDYDIGESDARVNRVFTNGLRTLNSMEIRDTVDTNIGWMIETQYSGNGDAVTFRGLNEGSYNYQIGSDRIPSRITNIYLRNNPDVSSDRNLKENINDLGLGLDFIKQLQPKNYRLKTTEADIKQGISENLQQFGFIAQDIVNLLREKNIEIDDVSLVNRSQDGYYSMKYEQLIAPVVRALQELAEEVEELRNEST